jgi:carbon-monoxide dehydrogenase medium subunit
MIPAQFDYVRPASLDEALRILTDREGEAKVLAGGYSLIPLLKLRLAQPGLLVDLRDVGGLDGIVETDDELRIGARATHRQIHEHPIIERYPLLHDVSGGIGDPQVRNWGTIGGSVAHADPASDWPAALLAANARVVCRGPAGERVIAAGDFATAGVATIVRIGSGGSIELAGVGVTGVSPSPFAATEAETALVGAGPSEDAFRRAGQAAATMSEPAADLRGPVDYKRAMVAELTVRSLRTAVQRALAYA